MNYSEVLKKNDNKSQYNNTINNYLHNGFSIIRKVNNKIEIKYSYNYQNIQNLNNEKKNKIILDKMINNWNNFRDQDIEYYGTRSIFYNYEKKIQNIIEEDNKINKELYDLINNLDLINSDHNSDNDEFY